MRQQLAPVAPLPERTMPVLGLVFTLDAVGSVSEFWRCGNLYLANTANTWSASCCGCFALDGTRTSPEAALAVFYATIGNWSTAAARVRELGVNLDEVTHG